MRRPGWLSLGTGGGARLLAAVLAVVIWCLVAVGADVPAGGRVRAGVFVSPPFVMEEPSGGYGGLAVDLWELTASRLDLRTEYVRYASVDALLGAAREGDIDIAVLTIAANHERARYLRYSFPWYESGLRIMARTETGVSFWDAIFRHHIRAYAVFTLIFMAMALAMTLVRRRHDPKFPGDWKNGFTQSLLDVVAAVRSGRLDQSYLGWVGSLISVAWMLFGVATAAYLTSSVTSSMTAASLGGNEIRALADLPGRRVGVLAGAMGETFLAERGIDFAGFPSVPDAIRALEERRIDAVVASGPALEYYVRSHPGKPLAVVGGIIHPDKYGFVTGKERDGFMRRVSTELIGFHETGKLDELRRRYFGDR